MSIIKNKVSDFCDDPSFEFDLNNEYYINFVDLEITEEEHTHKFIEFVYTLSGKGIHTVDGRDYHVKSGDMIVINHNRTHKVTPIEGFRYVDIMLKPEYVDSTLVGTNDLFLLLTLNDFSDLSSSVIKDNLLMHFDGEEKRKIEFLIEWTGKEQSANAPASGLILHSALSMLLCLIFRKMTENQSERFKINEHLLDFIRKNCSERLSIKEIALKCGYTPEHFSRIYKKYTGVSPTEFILSCKVDRAKKLIATTDMPIEAVMLECGFSNRTAFFKSFSKNVGCTPLKYRKNQK